MNNKHSFTKSQRVVSSRDFSRILRDGACAADGVLVLFALPVQAESPVKMSAIRQESRLGVTIARRTGNAVCRNRWKRWIRESFRTQQSMLPEGFDFIVRPKKNAVPSWHEIRRSVPRLAAKAVRRWQQSDQSQS